MPGMSGALGKDGQRVANGADVPSKEISPLPGFVVKTKDASRDGRKVFINVCQHEDIKNFSKRVQLMEDGTEQEGLSVPCSVGPPRPIKDKAGKPAVVFDVIVNPAVIKEATGDVTGSSRHWLVEIGMDRIDGKYKTALDRRYKLPKARYVGKVATQRIRLTQKPKIEAVVEDDGEDEKAKMNRSKKRKKLKKQPKRPVEYCKFRLYFRDTMGDPAVAAAAAAAADQKQAADAQDNAEEEEEEEENNEELGGWKPCPLPGEGTVPNPCANDLDLDVIPAQLRLSVKLPRLATVHALGDEDEDEGQKRRSQSSEKKRDRVAVELSPWMVVVRADGYHAVEVMLPYPVFSEAHARSGAEGGRAGVGGDGSMFDCTFDCSSRTLHVVLTVDTMALDFDPAPDESGIVAEVVRMGPDPGSRPWLLSQAITDASRPVKERVLGEKELEQLEKEQAEEDDDVFPEDRFHNMDAMSQHYNMQKEQGRREREQKQKEKEAAQAKEEAEAARKMEEDAAAQKAAEALFAKEHPEEAAKMAAEKEQQRLAEEEAKAEKKKEAKSDASPKAANSAKAALAEQKAKEAAAALIERKPVGFSLDESELENDLVFDLC